MKKKFRIWILLMIVVVFTLLKSADWLRTPALKQDQYAAYRNTTNLVLTNHVRCRMGCREVTLEE